jgi:glycosyltransferase involved in cell wall biosynthesis
VLFVHRDLPFHGGVPRCLLYFARACDHSRVDVHLGSFRESSHRMAEAFGSLGIKPNLLGDDGYLNPMREMAQLIQEEKIDVVVATCFKAYICAKFAARGRQTRVIFWLHAVRGAVEGPIRRLLVAVLSRQEPMIFVSHAVRKTQLPIGHIGPARVIHNGVEDIADAPEYQPYLPEMRETFGVPKGVLTLAFTAEFVGWKDHFTAIEAMHELARRGKVAHLLLVGAGELIDTAREWAAAGPAAQRIHFLGARSDARRILGAVDIYIHPSRGEGFGLAAVEAMLAGRPVIAARDGAFPEYIEHDKTGLLFEPGNASALADAIVQLASDPERAKQIGLASREHCRKEFNIDRFADAVCDFIEQSNFAFHHRQVQATHPTSLLLPNSEKALCES